MAIPTGTSAKKTTAKKQPGNDVVVTATVELLGVALLTILAGVSKQVGNVVVIVMVGFLVGWLLINTTELQGWLAKA